MREAAQQTITRPGYEALNQALDSVGVRGKEGWEITISAIKGLINSSYDAGALADYQFRILRAKAHRYHNMNRLAAP